MTGLPARLVQVDLGVLDGVLRLRPLVLQMLDVRPGVRAGDRGEHSYRQGPRRDGDGQALAGGGGEESHR
jgi:hypothetical protein